MTPARARLELAAATLFLSTGGAAIKFCALSPWQIASYRSAIGAAALLLFLPAARRGLRPATFLVGAAQASSMIVFVVANKLTTAAATIFLQSTAPLYLLALGPLVLHERPRRSDLAFLAALAGGMVLLLAGNQVPLASAPDPARGSAVAALGGVTWALTLLGLRWLGRGEDPAAAQGATAAGNLIAFLVCLPAALAAAPLVARPADVAVLAYLGVVQIALPYALLTHALRAVSALEASLFMLLEPVMNPLWAWLVQGEVPGWATLAGGGVILLATAVHMATER